MKQLTVLLSSFLITLMCSLNLNAQWYDVSNGLPNYYGYAYAIDAYDSLIATGPYTRTPAPEYIPDSLYLTTNGGNNWYTRPLPSNLERHDDLYDISIIGKDKIWFGTGKGKIYNTTDGGFNWQLQFYDTSMTKFMNYIEMFDSLNGMAMGDAIIGSNVPALFLKTTNGGIDWISQNDSYFFGAGSGDLWRRVDFIDINTGYFRSTGGGLHKTTNSGKDWQVYNDTIYCAVLKAYDDNIFLGEEYIDSSIGAIYRTIDGGQNWESNQFDFLGWGSDIEYIPSNPSNVWYAAITVCFSSDTGKTWVEEFRLENFFFRDIVFTDENNGWLLANATASSFKTRIFRTTNGGIGGLVSVDDNQSNLVISNYILEQNYPNPFNPTTIIKYQISELSFVTLKVYDVLGNEIATLVNKEKPIGSYEVEFSAKGGSASGGNAYTLPSGIYFYQLQAGDHSTSSGQSFVETKKMILLK